MEKQGNGEDGGMGEQRDGRDRGIEGTKGLWGQREGRGQRGGGDRGLGEQRYRDGGDREMEGAGEWKGQREWRGRPSRLLQERENSQAHPEDQRPQSFFFPPSHTVE